MSREKVYCKDCQYDIYAKEPGMDVICVSEFYTNLKSRHRYDNDKKCDHYKRIWWKFWIRGGKVK